MTLGSMMQSSPHRYSLPAVLLHWVMAAGLIGAIAVGWYMSELPMGLQRLKLINWHKWFGITLLMLFALRLVWRLFKRPPPPLPMPAWQAKTASAVHGLLYALMALVPLLGWAYSNAAGFPVVWFGVVPLPNIPIEGSDLAFRLIRLHGWLISLGLLPEPNWAGGSGVQLKVALKDLHKIAAWTLAVLIVAHIGAAFKHQFIDRDRLLARMGFGRD